MEENLETYRTLSQEISSGYMRVNDMKGLKGVKEKSVFHALTTLCNKNGESFPDTTFFDLQKSCTTFLMPEELSKIIKFLD